METAPRASPRGIIAGPVAQTAVAAMNGQNRLRIQPGTHQNGQHNEFPGGFLAFAYVAVRLEYLSGGVRDETARSFYDRFPGFSTEADGKVLACK
jgi:hypothetical protein